MSVLFVLSGEAREPSGFFGADKSVRAIAGTAKIRQYPRAFDHRHAFSLVRDARDQLATRWIRGMALAVVFGAIVGAITNAVLSIGFEMFSGLSSIAIPLGFLLGAFLGAFTAAMTGTHTARPGLRGLLHQVQPGDTLLQYHHEDRQCLQVMRSHCEARSIPCILLD